MLREKNLLIKFLEIDFRVVRENLEAERTFFSQLKKKCILFSILVFIPSAQSSKKDNETEQTTEQYNFSPRFSCPPSIPVNSVPIHHVVSLAQRYLAISPFLTFDLSNLVTRDRTHGLRDSASMSVTRYLSTWRFCGWLV